MAIGQNSLRTARGASAPSARLGTQARLDSLRRTSRRKCRCDLDLYSESIFSQLLADCRVQRRAIRRNPVVPDRLHFAVVVGRKQMDSGRHKMLSACAGMGQQPVDEVQCLARLSSDVERRVFRNLSSDEHEFAFAKRRDRHIADARPDLSVNTHGNGSIDSAPLCKPSKRCSR